MSPHETRGRNSIRHASARQQHFCLQHVAGLQLEEAFATYRGCMQMALHIEGHLARSGQTAKNYTTQQQRSCGLRNRPPCPYRSRCNVNYPDGAPSYPSADYSIGSDAPPSSLARGKHFFLFPHLACEALLSLSTPGYYPCGVRYFPFNLI